MTNPFAKLENIKVDVFAKLNTTVIAEIKTEYETYLSKKKELKETIGKHLEVAGQEFIQTLKKDLENDHRMRPYLSSHVSKDSEPNYYFKEFVKSCLGYNYNLDVDLINRITSKINGFYKTSLEPFKNANDESETTPRNQFIMKETDCKGSGKLNFGIIKLESIMNLLIADIPDLESAGKETIVGNFKKLIGFKRINCNLTDELDIKIKKDTLQFDRFVYISPEWSSGFRVNYSSEHKIHQLFDIINNFFNKVKQGHSFNYYRNLQMDKLVDFTKWYSCGYVELKYFKNGRVDIKFNSVDDCVEFCKYYELI